MPPQIEVPASTLQLQNKFIETLLKSQTEETKSQEIKNLLEQGASVTVADKNGMHPLTAAAYSCDLKILELVEEKLGDAAEHYWSKINFAEFEKYIQAQMPEIRPTGRYRASYEWLANWYAKNANKVWTARYDDWMVGNFLGGFRGATGWQQEDWQERSQAILASQDASREYGAKETWVGYSWSGYKINRPPVNTHDGIVYLIIEDIEKCKTYVKNKVMVEEEKIHFKK